MRTKQFAEEVVAEVAAVAPKDTIVAALVEMGLSAEQAEAVYQTAADLVATEPVAEEVKVEASRQRRPRRRKEMHRESRREFSRGELSRQDRRQTKTRMSQEDMRSAKLRREVRMLKKQMREMGAAPAEGPQTGNPLKREFTAPTIPTEGTPATRAFEIMKSFNLK